MEKYTQRIRIIMLCNTTGKLIPAIRSRCLLVRMPSPTDREIMDVLYGIC